MATVEWDRIMETCIKQSATEVLVFSGYPPMLRVGGGLAALQLPRMEASDIADMVEAFRHPPAARGTPGYQYMEHDGYKYLDIAYRDGNVFRAIVFGSPNPSAVLFIRLGEKPGTPPAESPGTPRAGV